MKSMKKKYEDTKTDMELRKHLQELFSDGIITDVETAFMLMKRKEFKEKEKKVLQVHKNELQKDITIIKHGKPTVVSQTRLEGKVPRYKDYETLIEFLYQYYFGDQISDYSFKTMFEAAIAEKELTEGPKAKTIYDLRCQYRAFITDEFAALDVRKITPSQMKAYIMQVVKDVHPTRKRFLKFKGVLNLVFSYVCDAERKYVTVNPVPTNNKPFLRYCETKEVAPDDKAFQPEQLKEICAYLWERIAKTKYDVNAYAILFSEATGVREGEIPSLRWEDVDFALKTVHIHSQQNDTYDGQCYEVRNSIHVSKHNNAWFYYNPTTKNEKGESKNGRFIPMTEKVRIILISLKESQKKLGIVSPWVFCKEDGDWITTKSYYSALRRLTKEKLGLSLSNNHAFRIALNSYVYIPMGLPVTERARLLGHSVETNLKHYSFSQSDNYIEDLTSRLDAFYNNQEVGHSRSLNTIPFQAKRKSPRTANS